MIISQISSAMSSDASYVSLRNVCYRCKQIGHHSDHPKCPARKAPRDKSTVQCYKCRKTGHYSDKCTEAPREEKKEEPVPEPARPSCIICLEAPKEVLLKPCNHVCGCLGCCSRLRHCPICRAEIVLRERIFVS